MMQVTQNTQAVLLLTAYFSKPRTDEPKPLTVKEWGRFAHWLKDQSIKPEQLIVGDPNRFLATWHDKTVTADRIKRLIDRGPALALTMEKWTRSGLWVVTRSDVAYPSTLKRKLKSDSPAFFFGCGNEKLLNAGGISVVGSRRASDDDLKFAETVGRSAADQGFSIVSGGARGIDEAAMLAALDAGGTVVGVLSDSLLRASSSQKYRRQLREKNLVLISPYYPEAGFNAGNAMARNKYIYCLSDAAIVVHAGKKGGTWNGSQEALNHAWVPIWVKQSQDREAGNEGIIRKGGIRLTIPAHELQLSDLIQNASAPSKIPDLLPVENLRPRPFSVQEAATVSTTFQECDTDLGETSLYELFLTRVTELCRDTPKQASEISEALGIMKSQADTWLRQAVSDDKLKKLTRPARYAAPDQASAQSDLFPRIRNA